MNAQERRPIFQDRFRPDLWMAPLGALACQRDATLRTWTATILRCSPAAQPPASSSPPPPPLPQLFDVVLDDTGARSRPWTWPCAAVGMGLTVRARLNRSNRQCSFRRAEGSRTTSARCAFGALRRAARPMSSSVALRSRADPSPRSDPRPRAVPRLMARRWCRSSAAPASACTLCRARLSRGSVLRSSWTGRAALTTCSSTRVRGRPGARA